MSGYRRFIAYVYEYRKGKKGGNCGFLKVEVKNQRCLMELHLHCAGLPPQVECRAYGFLRKDGLMNGILLGTCLTKVDTVESTFETDALNMAESGVPFGKLGGVVLLTEPGGFFGTEWDDQPVRPDNFRELRLPVNPKESTAMENRRPAAPPIPASIGKTKTKSESEPETKPAADADAIKDAALNMTIESIEEAAEEPISDTTVEKNRNETSPDTNNQNILPQTLTMENLPEKEVSDTNTPNTNHEIPAPPTEPPVHITDTGISAAKAALPEPKPQTPPAEISAEKNSSPPATAVTENPAPISEAEDVQTTEAAAQNPPFRFPVEEFSPFDDVEFVKCWKIQPADLGRCTSRVRTLRNNRFLQYGYYNFGHLLLARRPGGRFILGVPGGYDQQERFMANMFGFPYFKECRSIELPRNRGGYWYRLIDAPNFR